MRAGLECVRSVVAVVRLDVWLDCNAELIDGCAEDLESALGAAKFVLYGDAKLAEAGWRLHCFVDGNAVAVVQEYIACAGAMLDDRNLGHVLYRNLGDVLRVG